MDRTLFLSHMLSYLQITAFLNHFHFCILFAPFIYPYIGKSKVTGRYSEFFRRWFLHRCFMPARCAISLRNGIRTDRKMMWNAWNSVYLVSNARSALLQLYIACICSIANVTSPFVQAKTEAMCQIRCVLSPYMCSSILILRILRLHFLIFDDNPNSIYIHRKSDWVASADCRGE